MFMPLHAEKILHFSKMDAASTVSAYGLANMVFYFFAIFPTDFISLIFISQKNISILYFP
jgi:hypothetical protein